MNQKAVSLICIAASAAYLFAQTNATLPKASKSVDNAKIVEGTISTVDIENNMLVMNARIMKEDSVRIDSTSIIKAGAVVSDRKDLKPYTFVRAQYQIKNGEKLATVVVTRPDVSFLPDTTEFGNKILIAEGTIHFIDQAKNLMVIQAPLEREYIFSVDPSTIIKSGIRPVPLKDLKPYYSAKVSYTEKAHRKIATSITTRQ